MNIGNQGWVTFRMSVRVEWEFRSWLCYLASLWSWANFAEPSFALVCSSVKWMLEGWRETSCVEHLECANMLIVDLQLKMSRVLQLRKVDCTSLRRRLFLRFVPLKNVSRFNPASHLLLLIHLSSPHKSYCLSWHLLLSVYIIPTLQMRKQRLGWMGFDEWGG